MKLTGSTITVAIAFGLAWAVPSPAQDNSRYRTRIDTVVGLERQGTVDLSLISGRIAVIGWDRQDVKVSASVDRGYLKFDAAPSRLRLGVTSERGNVGSGRFELSVPRGTRVLVNSVSGSLSAEGSRGEVDANSVSGGVVISDAIRRVSVETVSGGQRIAHVQGDLRSGSVSGRIELSDVVGDVEAETVSGRISVSRATSKYVRAGSVSGRVSYGGTIDPAGRYEFQSHSGSIRVALPASSGARFSVETFSGSIESDFPVTLQPTDERRQSQKKFEFQVGNGRARITAESFSGSIYIIRGADRDMEK